MVRFWFLGRSVVLIHCLCRCKIMANAMSHHGRRFFHHLYPIYCSRRYLRLMRSLVSSSYPSIPRRSSDFWLLYNLHPRHIHFFPQINLALKFFHLLDAFFVLDFTPKISLFSFKLVCIIQVSRSSSKIYHPINRISASIEHFFPHS